MRTLLRMCSKDYWRGVMLLAKVALTGNYRGSFLGDFWMILQPVFYITTISLAFSVILRIPTKDYALYLVSGLLPWQMITACFTGCANSLISRETILKRTRIPKTMFVLADVMVQFYTFLISFTSILVVVTLFITDTVHGSLIWLPIAILPLLITCAAGGIAMAYLGPYVRDIGHLLSVLFNALFWTLPLVYMITSVPEEYLLYFHLNPFFMLINPIQQVVYYGNIPSSAEWASGFGVALFTTLAAIFIHTKLRRNVVYYL